MSQRRAANALPSLCTAAAAITCALVLGCNAPKSEALPVLEAPWDLSLDDEPVFVRAHFEQFMRSVADNHGVRYDSQRHVVHQHVQLTADLYAWQIGMAEGDEWLDYEYKQEMLERTPEARRFRGARERAVVLGVLAQSLWRRRPPAMNPSVAELLACTGAVRLPCQVDPRTRSLKRAILMGMYADRDLFDRLSKAAWQAQRQTSRTDREPRETSMR